MKPLGHWLILGGILLAGMWLTLHVTAAVRADAEAQVRDELTSLTRERVEQLRTQVLRSMESLNAISALFTAVPETTRSEFRTFVAAMLERQPELQALEWIPRVAAAEREAYELAAAADGLDGFRITELTADGALVPAGIRGEYFPVFYLEPLRGNAPALGLDLFHHPERRAALDQARASGQAVATAPVRLAQGPTTRSGFLVFQPVTPPSSGHLGFGLAVFRLDRLVGPALGPLAERGLQIELHDIAAPGPPLQVLGTPTPGMPAWSRTERLAFAGRTWEVRVAPGADLPPAPAGALLWLAPAGILTVTFLLAGYLLAGLHRTAEIERKVREKTAELSREVAEREHAERIAREAERRSRSIVENAIDGIFQSTPEGRYLSVNPALARMYGYASTTDLLAAFSDIGSQLYIDPNRRTDFIAAVSAQGSVTNFVSQVRRRDGSVIWISENVIVVRDDAGAVQYFEGIVGDVTAQVQASEQREHAHEFLESRVAERTAQLAEANVALTSEVAERMRAEAAAEAANSAKTQFLANMSHELRTPLNAILGHAQLLRLDPGLDRERGSALQAITEGGRHLLTLVNGVLDLSKIEAGHMDLEPVAFDLDVLLRGLEALFAQRCRQKQLALHITGGGSRWVQGDEGKLRQVLINLLANAIAYTAHGEVRLCVVDTEGDAIRFSVTDTGPGIPAAAQALIFEPFHQEVAARGNGGTGLGLTISRRLVALMGGDLTVQAVAGQGSMFAFEVPLPRLAQCDPHADDRRLQGLRLADGQRVRALVLDDLESNRDVLARLLRHLGCTVALAADPAQAAAILADEPADIAFIDLRLSGMEGTAWVRALRQRLPDLRTRFVSYSASAFAHDRARCAEAGFAGFLPKPVRLDDLHACLMAVLAVTFTTPERSASQATVDTESPSALELALPESLRCTLRAAAEIGDCAELRRLLMAWPAEGEAALWRGRLLLHVERFATDALIELLSPSPAPLSVPVP